MQQLQKEIIKLVQEIKSEEALKILYYFIKGLRSGR